MYGEPVGRKVHVVLDGKPTWEAYGLRAAQEDILEEGFKSFDREKQQNVEDVEGALWTTEGINETRLSASDRTRLESGEVNPSHLTRKVVGVDPATTSKGTSDETGIVGAGKWPADSHGVEHGVVLKDESGTYTPSQWGRRAVRMHDRLDAKAIIAEKNQGGEMVQDTIENAAKALWREGRRQSPRVNVVLVSVHDGKRVRADPIAQKWEEETAHIMGSLPELEHEMTTWDGSDGGASPNRIDAMVQGLTHLLLKTSHPKRKGSVVRSTASY